MPSKTQQAMGRNYLILVLEVSRFWSREFGTDDEQSPHFVFRGLYNTLVAANVTFSEKEVIIGKSVEEILGGPKKVQPLQANQQQQKEQVTPTQIQENPVATKKSESSEEKPVAEVQNAKDKAQSINNKQDESIMKAANDALKALSLSRDAIKGVMSLNALTYEGELPSNGLEDEGGRMMVGSMLYEVEDHLKGLLAIFTKLDEAEGIKQLVRDEFKYGSEVIGLAKRLTEKLEKKEEQEEVRGKLMGWCEHKGLQKASSEDLEGKI